jgi:hypothetical protein
MLTVEEKALPAAPKYLSILQRLEKWMVVAFQEVSEKKLMWKLCRNFLCSDAVVLVQWMIHYLPPTETIEGPDVNLKKLFQILTDHRKDDPHSKFLLPALYKVKSMLRDAIDNHQLIISFPKRFRSSDLSMPQPDEYDRECKMILIAIFLNGDLGTAKNQGLDTWVFSDRVPSALLENIYSLIISTLAKWEGNLSFLLINFH